jgi:transcriptional regulator with XRE-family HTH domain
MDLDEYLKTNKIKGYQFARAVGVHKTYLSQLRQGKRWPSRKLMLRISEATDGQVTADSFLNGGPNAERL